MKPDTANISLILYGTDGCHLCEDAVVIMRELIAAGVPLQLEQVDIIDNDALLARYRDSIPVLKFVDSDAELSWPFDHQQVLDLLNRP